jgi:D-alanyl-D-alanine carboxypeptidase (penicillin-binding protein 5/6)
MTRTTQVQIFLLVLIVGFLTGPRVMLALQKITPEEGLFRSRNEGQLALTQSIEKEAAPKIRTQETSPYANLDLKAKSIFVWDIKTHRKLYGYNEQEKLPLASITKMMMAVVASELLPSDTKITIAPVDLLLEGDSGLYVGEKWTLADLLKFTLVASSNDGASAIAGVAGASMIANATTTDPFTSKKLFIEKMNAKARDIGLKNTHFSNESGLDIDSLTGGAYGSARDMGMLFEYILNKHPELFTATTYAKFDVRSENNIVHHVANTNVGVEHIAGFIASKTGYTDLAGGNLVVVLDIGIDHPIVIAVLGSTRGGRFVDADKLINAAVLDISEGVPNTERSLE